MPASPPATMIPPPPVRTRGPLRPPINFTDVYMDDFIHFCQLPTTFLDAARSTLFTCIDQVIRPLHPSDNPHRKEPISVKKLDKGDASWSTRKSILGWTIDTQQRTIELPSHRLERLSALLAELPRSQRRTSRLKWQKLLGELRSMALAIPGIRGLFSQLQSVLTHTDEPKPTDRLSLSTAVHDQLDDLRWLVQDLGSRPTRWGEIVASTPTFLGTVDASGMGMGGTWLSSNDTMPPLLWRFSFDDNITRRLVSADNPTGNLTNSDLEQLALACHPDILTTTVDVREQTICTLSDNIAAISREQRGSTSTDAPAAYLCRNSALHQRAFRYLLLVDYLPGPLNTMADDLSRRWDLSDEQLLTHFDSSYPQAQPWRLCTLRNDFSSAMIQALSMKRCSEACLGGALPPNGPTGRSGSYSVDNSTWIPSCPKASIQSSGSKFSRLEYEQAGFPPPVNPSSLARWLKPSPTLHRRTQWPTTQTHGAHQDPLPSTHALH
jgi:hypothetical protein